MKNVVERIGRRKVAMALLLVGAIVAFTVAYAFFQTSAGLAILTAPPPGIPGPYYVTAEAKIYGPVVDLATIKSKMGGEYASDYTYVQWGTNPFYRVYVDNTLQEIYYGQMIDVMDQFSWDFAIENNLNDTYNNLVNVGAVDPTSVLGTNRYFGNMPGTYVAVYNDTLLYPTAPSTFYSIGTIITNTSYWYATEALLRTGGGTAGLPVLFTIALDGSTCLSIEGASFYNTYKKLNATGTSGGSLFWNLTLVWTQYGPNVQAFAATLYLRDLLYFETTISSSTLRIYAVVDSPGTGFVSKYVSPSSPVIGSTVNVTVRLDPPAARNMNITDKYPNTFSWTGSQVVLKKFKIGVGLAETASVSVTPNPDGSNMKFTVYYNQATNILESLLSDEYVYMSYTLTAPITSGEYTMPSATMTYLIPLPQT